MFVSSFDSELHEGQWLFLVKACVDRRTEEYGSIDCDNGQNYLYVEFISCENVEDAESLPECQKTEVEEIEEEEEEDIEG